MRKTGLTWFPLWVIMYIKVCLVFEVLIYAVLSIFERISLFADLSCLCVIMVSTPPTVPLHFNMSKYNFISHFMLSLGSLIAFYEWM